MGSWFWGSMPQPLWLMAVTGSDTQGSTGGASRKINILLLCFLQTLKHPHRSVQVVSWVSESLLPAARHGQPVSTHGARLVQAWWSWFPLLALYSFPARDTSVPLLSTLTSVTFLSSGSWEAI